MVTSFNGRTSLGCRLRALGRRLAAGASSLALAAGLVVVHGLPAQAANFTASNQTELVAAMNQANASGDASSTITLAGSFSINNSALPTVSKTLTIDVGTYTLTSAGPRTIDVGSGATLTVNGSIRITGDAGYTSVGGRLIKTGDGTLNLTGGTSTLTWYIENRSGNLIIKDGANVTFDSSTGPAATLTTGTGSVTVSGAGTVVRDKAGANIWDAGPATLNIEKGARYVNDHAMALGSTPGSMATVNVTGVGTRLEGPIYTQQGSGVVNVRGGATVASSVTFVGIVASVNTAVGLMDRGGSADLLVSGAGSRWENERGFLLTRGTLTVLDGGVVTTDILRVGSFDKAVTTAAVGSVLVSGAGSKLLTSGTAANTFIVGGGAGAGVKKGTLTVANGALVNAAEGAGTIDLASTAGSEGTIHIGGAAGQAATRAGTIEAGLIQFGAGTGTINFNHTDSDYEFDTALAVSTGSAFLNQIGSGRTFLNADQSAFTGLSTVRAGALSVNGTLGGTMDVRGGRLEGIGSVGNTFNYAGGTIAPGNSIGTLTVSGDYTSEGGALEIEAELGDDASPTDLLRITGDSIMGAGGATQVRVLNVGGLGAETTGDGIKIVDVDGASAADAFVLSGPAIGGLHRYNLFQHDLLGTGDDGDWYLRADGLAPTLPTYESYPSVMLGLIALPTLQQRVGDRRPDLTGPAADSAVWTRIEAAHARVKADSATVGSAYDSDLFQLQVGLDGEVLERASGSLVAGITAQYSRVRADVTSDLGNGSNTTEGYGVGASLTWYGQNGLYVDGQAQYAWFDSKLSADGAGTLVDGNNGTG
jgi:T5SS/PEP-CTERM-associated repeat protein/autotransporter-associated beta strand protein